MLRKIIHIDEEACNGCGLCAAACHEGAIDMVNGKARLVREDFCDGLGDCLPACPTGAIRFEVREAPAYDQAAVRAAAAERGCAGAAAREISPSARGALEGAASALRQWPVQIRLAPVQARWLDGAKLLIAADCCAYAYGAFHRDFIDGRATLIGCPKLDQTDYAEKIGAMLRENEVREVLVARMEVPCCGGLERAVRAAIEQCGRDLPLRVVTLSTDGRIL